MATPRVPSAEAFALHGLPSAANARRTHALLKASSLELVLLVLREGHHLPWHAAPGEITLQGLDGRLVIDLPDRAVVLEPGHLLHLGAGEPHAVRAEADSRALLTLCLHSPPHAAPPRPSPTRTPITESST